VNFIDNWSEISAGLKETRLDTEQIYKGVLLDVRRDKVRLPDKSESEREYIKHPGASVVLPVYENGDIMLVGQYRYPVQQALLEVPAGKLDPGESPETTGRRELTEETGLQCDKLQSIGFFHPCIGYSDEVIHLFVGWGLTETSKNTDDDEFLSHHRLSFRDALELVYNGSITDSKTIITLLKTWKWWQDEGPFQI